MSTSKMLDSPNRSTSSDMSEDEDEGMFVCEKCNERFPGKFDLDVHEVTSHTTRGMSRHSGIQKNYVKKVYLFACDKCKAHCKTKNALDLHKKKFHTKNKMIPTTKPNNKELSGRRKIMKVRFAKMPTVKKTQEKTGNRFRINGQANLTIHIDSHVFFYFLMLVLVCDQCKRRYTRADHFSKHRYRVHQIGQDCHSGKTVNVEKPKPRIKKEKLAVDQTGQDRSGNASIAGNPQGSGANGQHSVVTIRIKKEIPEDAMPFKCDKCGIAFIHQVSLGAHKCKNARAEKRRQVQKEYSCRRCGEKFEHSEARNQHWKTMHFGGSQFCCIICNIDFTENDALIQHLQRDHTMTRDFKCAQCNFSFFEDKDLHIHMRQAHRQPRSESQAAKFRLLSPASKTVALKKIRMERAERTRALKQESKNRYAQRATRNRSFTTSRRRRRRRQKTKSIASSVKLELDDTAPKKDVLVKVPEEPVTKAPEEPVTKAPEEPVTKAPEEVVTKVPEDPVTKAPEEVVTKSPEEVVTKSPEEPVTKAPEEVVTKSPEEVVTKSPEEPVTKAPEEVVTKAPEEVVTKAPEEVVAKAPEEVVTQALEDPVTQAPQDTVVQAPKDPVTQVPEDSATKGIEDFVAQIAKEAVDPGFNEVVESHGDISFMLFLDDFQPKDTFL
ncbi:zinc finger protein 91-like isoform X2 [Folsomia candida]|uniref:zinc finger protein 91-like isoform X2 n=1 Tax=Folsomia candida TaxID=158441 RepID=UPI0016052A28|nr:zinc finger protein 91-like isoform X2 [Folsomia candida]